MSRRPTAVAMLVGSALSFGAMAFLSKLATRTLDGATVAAARFAVGLLAGGALVVGGLLRPRPRRLRLMALRGLLGGGAVLLYFLTIEHMAVGVATLLNFTAPVFTAIFAHLFLGESLGLAGVGAFTLAGCGVTLVVLGQPSTGPIPPPPALWTAAGLTSSMLSGGAVTTIRALRQGERPEAPWDIFLVFCGVGLVGALPFAHPARAPHPLELALLVGVGLTAIGGQLLMNGALRWVPATLYGIIAQLTVLSAMTLGVTLLGEPWSATSVTGAALTLVGVAWAARLGTG